MACSSRYTFTIIQGSTYEANIQYTDSLGVPVDLSNYGAKMQLRPYPGSPVIYLTLSSSLQNDRTGLNMSGSTGLVSPASGNIGIYISAATSSMLDFDTAEYDLFIISGSYATRLLEGKIKLDKQVTI